MSTFQAKGRRYILAMLLAACVSASVAFAFVFVVDPYKIYETKEIHGFNKHKTETAQRMRAIRPFSVWLGRPKSAIFGSSSAAAGFDPRNTIWPQPAYNMAFSAGRLSETLASLRYASSYGLETALIVLDFTNFHADTPKGQLQLVSADSFLAGWFGNSSLFLDQMKVTVGPDAIADSIRTIVSQNDERRINIHANRVDKFGMRTSDFSNRQIVRLGQSEAFRRKILHRMTKTWFFNPCREWRFRNDDNLEPGFDQFLSLLEFSRNQNIDARFVIPAVHPSLIVAMEEIGILGHYEHWKKQLSEIAAKEAAGRDPFAIYDFGVISNATREPVPNKDETATMTKFFDPLHFKPEVGDQIFDRVFLDEMLFDDPAFGYVLTPTTVSAHLTDQRQRLKQLPERRELHKRFVEPNLSAHKKWKSNGTTCR